MGSTAEEAWHGEPALRVRGGRGLEVVAVPGRGGKLVSLTDPSGREWLLQPGPELPPPARGAAVFTDADMCGWDECIPSVDADVAAGVDLPDHGDAWTTPWEPHDDGAWGYEGRVLPYRLTRTIEPTATGLRLGYRAEATTDAPVPVAWAAHPQFHAPPGSRIVLPPEVSHVVGVFPLQGRHPWTDELASVDALADGGALKIWVDRATPAGWAALVTADGPALRLSWDPAQVPFLALWVDAGMFARDRVIALEPSTGSSERLSTAITDGSALWLRPGEPVTWWVDVEVVPAVG